MSLSRRRFLCLTSAACLMAPAAQAFRWQGTALGAQAQIILDHPDARAITERALAEISRLENSFSLYREGSEISRLNATGRLDAPSFELLECMSIARRVHLLTEGRFDPTVQPLWQVFAQAHIAGQSVDREELAAARQAVGFERVTFDSGSIALAQGQQITLNGIAQGYIADRVAHLMRTSGIRDVLIDTGEIVAMGGPDGAPAWPVTIEGEARPRQIANRAIATSAPFGMVLDTAGKIGHILDPQNESTGPFIRQISLSAKQAAFADALSTGLCLVQNADTLHRVMRNVRDARLETFEVNEDTT